MSFLLYEHVKYLSHLASKEYLKKIVLRFTTILGKGEIHIVLGGQISYKIRFY